MTDPGTTTQIVEQAPYWFAAVLGVAGVVLGVLLKAIIDALSSISRNRREDRFRFVADKREAYADLLAACHNLADVEHADRRLVLSGRALDARTDVSDAQEDDYDAEFDANRANRLAAFREVNRTAAIVDVLAPADVAAAASLLISRAHHPHLLPRRVEAERAFVDAARADLGYKPIAHLPEIPYEERIGADHPDSGLDPASE